jgi:hypothetical protein
MKLKAILDKHKKNSVLRKQVYRMDWIKLPLVWRKRPRLLHLRHGNLEQLVASSDDIDLKSIDANKTNSSRDMLNNSCLTSRMFF